MNTKTKTLLAGALLASSSVVATSAQAATTGNLGATSNYLWRGVTQTTDQAAIQGGVDWGHDSGAYVGGWVSNVSWTTPAGYELDVYGGYAFETGAFSHDVGAIFYLYPVGDGKNDFTEIYYNFGWSWISAGAAFTVAKESDAGTNDIYAYFGGDWEMGKGGLGLGFVVGRYTFDGASDSDYNHLNLHMTKDDFTVAIDKNDTDNTAWGTGSDDVRFSVSWSKDFDLLK